jgi:hypothetical protein
VAAATVAAMAVGVVMGMTTVLAAIVILDRLDTDVLS